MVTVHPGGTITVAAALYTASLASALVLVEDSQLIFHLHILWRGVPNMAALKAMVQTTFGIIDSTVIEDIVRF